MKNSKHIFLLTFFLFAVQSFVIAQACPGNINMPVSGSCTTCSGFFYDSGGSGGTYLNNENRTYTICPSTPGGRVQMVFTTFNIENNFDFMYVYDGNSTAAPSLGTYTGTMGPGTVQATIGNTSGCITIRFTSDGSVTSTGWAATISCVTPCQTINAVFNNSTPAANANIIRICQGGTVNFNGSGTFSSSGAGATYTWSFGDATSAVGTSVSKTYNNAGSYSVNLVVRDPGGCQSNNTIGIIVQVSTTPTLTTLIAPNPICLGQSANLTANVTMNQFTVNCTPPVAGTTFLPDGSGVSYSTSIPVNCYNPGQTVTSANDIQNICLNMEHSYLGDLEIVIICPNGQSVVLKSYAQGGVGTYLGCPLDDPAVGPGTGRTYCFTPTAVTQLVNGPTSACGNPVSASINAGNYAPLQSFAGLIGCPLNGNWTIRVTDNLAQDNGYIFSWDINLAAAVPGASSFTPTIVTQGWQNATGLTNTSNTTATVTPVATGSQCYNYRITDNHGCTYNAAPQCVTVNALPTANISGPTANCSGNPVTLTASGGSSYSWSTGSTSASISVNPTVTTTYTVTVTNVNGCTATTTRTVVPSSYTSSTTITNASCGLNNGVVSAQVVGGVSPFTYNWSNGGNTSTINNLGAGTYTVTITDNAGCTSTTSGIITQPNSFTSNLLPTQVLCNGQTNGSVTLTNNGGSAPYVYNWSNGRTTQNITGLASGSYTVTVNDANGCTSTATVNITQPAVLSANNAPTQILCNGAATGAINLTVSGGTTTYNYIWSNGANTEDLTNITVGTYTVTVTDANGCTTTNSATLTQPTALQTSVNQITPQTCSNGGTVSVNISGGIAPYTYAWSNGANTQNVSGLNTGSYTVSITDANGCTISNGPNAIVNIAPPTVTLSSVTNVSCNGQSNGSLDMNLIGGTPQYVFNWSNGRTTLDVTGLVAGNYSLTVTDSLGCVLNLTNLVVSEPTVLTSSNTIINVLCNGGNNASIDLTVNGGTANYTYLWNNGATSQDLSSILAGSYTVTFTDANGCTSSSSAVITEPTALQTSTTQIIPQTCSYDGSIDINISGGVSTYTYNWSNGANTQNITGLIPGSYTVTITDSNGCTISNGPNAIVNIPSQTVTLDNIGSVSCNSLSDGNISINVAGGTPQFSYLWNNGQTTQDISGLLAGNYSVTVTDSLGCIVDLLNLTVTEPTSLTASNTHVDVLCNGGNNASVDLLPNGGTITYTYLWSNGATTEDISGLVVGTYDVTVTDANGCQTSSSATVSEPSALQTSTAQIIDQTCTVPGSIDINVSGGTSGYTFLWSNAQTTEDLSAVSAGTYTVTITDANGCNILNSANLVTLIGAPNVNVDLQSNISCNGGTNGTINISTNGGTQPYQFLWSNNQTTEDISGLNAGTYVVTISDAFGCVISSSAITLTEPAILTASNTTLNLQCNNLATGEINVTVLGGTSPYSYSWSNGNLTQNLTNINAGNYAVSITDANGCTTSLSSIQITEPTAIIVNNISTIDASCGLNDGSIGLDVSGGTTGYNYLWSNGETNEDINSLAGGTYTLVVTDANNCTVSSSAINLNATPAVNVSSSSTNELCNTPQSGTANVTVNTGTGPYVYTWSNGETSSSLSNLSSGTYLVTVTDADNCTATSSTSVSTPFQPNNQAFVSPSNAVDTTVSWGDVITLIGNNDQSAQGVTYSWTFNGPSAVNFSNQTGISTNINPDEDGIYQFILTSTSADGCISVDTVFITVEATDPMIPTAFSPNSDGINEIFEVLNLDKQFLTEFTVYDRWGQKVFDDKDKGFWDGTFNSVLQPRDVYMYVISWKNASGDVDIIKRGQVTLMR
jgi:gliding motility-associated-like protein